MRNQEAQNEREFIQQDWNSPFLVASYEQPWARPTIDTSKSLPTIPDEIEFSDDEFGDFVSATILGNDSWVSLTHPQAGCYNSHPPSPLPRGYLRSNQSIEHFYDPMDLYSDTDDADDLSSYEKPFVGYAPLLVGSSKDTLSSQIRHGTSTQRLWAMGKQALAKLTPVKKTKEATTVRVGQRALMTGEVSTPKHKDCGAPVVSQAAPREEVKEEVKEEMKEEMKEEVIERLPQSWIEAEREAWDS